MDVFKKRTYQHVGVEQHSIIPNIWADLCGALASGQLSLQQLHDTLHYVTTHCLQKRVAGARSLYSVVHWDYIPAVTEFLQQVCSCMVSGWKESVDSSAVRVDEGIYVVFCGVGWGEVGWGGVGWSGVRWGELG